MPAVYPRPRSVTPTKGEEGNLLRSSSPILRSPGALPKDIITGSYINVLLVFVPVSLPFGLLGWSGTATFALAFLSLIPLAAMLGDITEDLARHTNAAFGALLNATFGNATEVIISFFALHNEMYDVIKSSLLGSVLGNTMLVLGTALLAGGIRQRDVTFNQKAVNIYTSLLLLAIMGVIVPTSFYHTLGASQAQTLSMSRAIAILMCLSYIAYLFFQLRTHKERFEADDDEEEEEAQMPLWLGVGLLALVTILISFESQFLVNNLETTAVQWGLGRTFISVILLPIVGNAAEHATAVLMAYRNKMDIACGVAIGSAIQISLFAIPLMVLVSWVWGKSLDLNFHPFSTIGVFLSVLVTNSLVYDGESNWLEGVLLLCAYCMLAIAYLFVPYNADYPLTPTAYL
eukprot:TRINITY_DN8066_c1_g1_i1.p1 TRINITY_DN8066_c1_g1~~TRINITY_DN8066_c1_g1_i1.p1  ORF type:complete len:403 (+),score=63.52 TRINITY_DN8066_c1_g1_i1:178-1386(+)